MKKLPYFFLFLGIPIYFSSGQDYEVDADADSSDAPIYVLNGEADTTFLVDGDIDVAGSFIFSMDDASSPNVVALGTYTVTRAVDWDADLQASSTYKISSYGEVIRVRFNHLAGKSPAPGSRLLMENIECETGQILSKGSMYLVAANPYFLSGRMSGYVRGQVAGETVKSCNYKKVDFTQSIDVIQADWGDWTGSWDIFNAAGRLSGNGTITIGPLTDPVEIVNQTATATLKDGVLSLRAAGSPTDKKVRVSVKIRPATEELVNDGKNSVSAAAQTRRF